MKLHLALLFLSLSSPLLLFGQNTIGVTDLGGREALSNNLTSSRTTLNLSTLPAGTYVLQFIQETKLYTRHLHVMR